MSDQEPPNRNPLTLYNSLTRSVERFKPDDPARVTMYACGPTVYSYAHIGNARAAVVADVLFRVLRHIYGEDAVVYARNITDVDDKIIAAARDQDVPISAITEKYARIYNDDLAALNCLPPTHQPRATQHIQQMADLIVELLDKGAAYEAQGHIYFDVTSDADYGKLSGRKLGDNLAGARVAAVEIKRNPGDFVLWKPAKAGEPGWGQQETSENYFVDWRNYADQPFATAPGRPGWHIECSAMIREVLGETIDIHTGGIDLKFPHHENEIAQSECANAKPLARWWVHNEFLNMGRSKMSKSEGNVVLVHELLKEWDGEVIRLALLKAHYRSELTWSEELLRESKTQLDRWYRMYKERRDYLGELASDDRRDHFINTTRHLFEDLDTPRWVGSLSKFMEKSFEEFEEVTRIVAEKRWPKDRDDLGGAIGVLQAFVGTFNVLGFLQRDPDDWFRGNVSADDTARFDALAEARGAARAAKNWAEADRIRDEGAALGIVFEDGLEGTRWRKA